MKIKRPEWEHQFGMHSAVCIRNRNDEIIHEVVRLSKQSLNKWFDRTVAPFEFYDPKDAVILYGKDFGDERFFDDEQLDSDTHQCLAINIEPIKKPTAEEILKELLEDVAFFAMKRPGRIDDVALRKVYDATKRAREKLNAINVHCTTGESK